jgi:hypothetical protein
VTRIVESASDFDAQTLARAKCVQGKVQEDSGDAEVVGVIQNAAKLKTRSTIEPAL